MFIIWGSQVITRNLGQGVFYCPRCRALTCYSHQRVENWFTLYFIPLFPKETIGEAVRCGECTVGFLPAILMRTADEIERMTAPWTCASCRCLNPSSESQCLNCKAFRPQQLDFDPPPPKQLPPPRAKEWDAVRQGPPPQSVPPRVEQRSDTPNLSAIYAKNKGRVCRACGTVANSVAVKCRGCGNLLDEK